MAICKRNVVWFADLIKLLYWDGSGLCLFSKRLEQGQFSWPTMQAAGQTVEITRTQLGMLLEGIKWRIPERRWRPLRAGWQSPHRHIPGNPASSRRQQIHQNGDAP